MTKRELLEKLERFPDDAEVVVPNVMHFFRRYQGRYAKSYVVLEYVGGIRSTNQIILDGMTEAVERS